MSTTQGWNTGNTGDTGDTGNTEDMGNTRNLHCKIPVSHFYF